MFCKSCGKEINDSSKFCSGCGTTIGHKLSDVDDKLLVYSKDWNKTGFFVASIPNYDIMVGEDNFYVLSFPRFYAGTVGLVLGLFIFNIFGAIAGSMIGSSSEKKKREKIRSNWLDINGKLSSKEYLKNIFLQIPLVELKKSLSIEGRQLGLKEKALTISYLGKNINLKYKKGEYEKVAELINKL